MKRLLLIATWIGLIGCAPAPRPFLGFPEDRAQRIGDKNPRSPYPDIVRMTKVARSRYSEYVTAKNEGRIVAEEQRGNYIYYAVRTRKQVDPKIEGEAPLNVDVIERYKAKAPASGQPAKTLLAPPPVPAPQPSPPPYRPGPPFSPR